MNHDPFHDRFMTRFMTSDFVWVFLPDPTLQRRAFVKESDNGNDATATFLRNLKMGLCRLKKIDLAFLQELCQRIKSLRFFGSMSKSDFLKPPDQTNQRKNILKRTPLMLKAKRSKPELHRMASRPQNNPSVRAATDAHTSSASSARGTARLSDFSKFDHPVRFGWFLVKLLGPTVGLKL